MAFFFLDTSAAVKRYLQETGTAWLRALAAPAAGHFFFIARITDVELAAALARRRKGMSLTPSQAQAALQQFRIDLARDYRVAEITLPLLQHAAQLADTYALRGYDAVQLAAALAVAGQVSSLTLISADAELNAAAAAAGLLVEDPNSHP